MTNSGLGRVFRRWANWWPQPQASDLHTIGQQSQGSSPLQTGPKDGVAASRQAASVPKTQFSLDTGIAPSLLASAAVATVALWLLPLYLYFDWRYALSSGLPGCHTLLSYLCERGAVLLVSRLLLAVGLGAAAQHLWLLVSNLPCSERPLTSAAPFTEPASAPVPRDSPLDESVTSAHTEGGPVAAPPQMSAPPPQQATLSVTVKSEQTSHCGHALCSKQPEHGSSNCLLQGCSTSSTSNASFSISNQSNASGTIDPLFESGPEDLCAADLEEPASADCQSVEEHAGACVLCADFAAGAGTASQLGMLRVLYRKLDKVVARSPHLYKLNADNASYMVASGLRWHRRDACPARTLVDFGKLIMKVAATVCDPVSQQPLKMRVGVHAGSAMGARLSDPAEQYLVFGSVLDSADQLRSLCQPGTLLISPEVHEQLEDHHICSGLGVNGPVNVPRPGEQLSWAGPWQGKRDFVSRSRSSDTGEQRLAPILPPVLSFDKPPRKAGSILLEAGNARYAPIGWEVWQSRVLPAPNSRNVMECYMLQLS